MKLNVTVGSNTQYDHLIAYIENDEGLLIGIINQEEGYNKLKIQIPIDPSYPSDLHYKDIPGIDLDELEKAIIKAKERLSQLSRVDPPIEKPGA
jgi:hypothetical protein